MSAKKELSVIIRRARQQGWTVEMRRSNHLVFRNPDGAPYFTGSSPSDWRAARKLEADLAKMGYQRKGR